MANIIRAQNADEKKNFKLLGTPTVEKKFHKEVSKIQQEYTAKSLPFCRSCAVMDFKEEVGKRETELLRTTSADTDRIKKLSNLDFGNFSKYGGLDKFEVVGTPAELKSSRVNSFGIQHSFLEGYNIDFKCKERGFVDDGGALRSHGCSVHVKADDWETWVKENGFGKDKAFEKSSPAQQEIRQGIQNNTQ